MSRQTRRGDRGPPLLSKARLSHRRHKAHLITREDHEAFLIRREFVHLTSIHFYGFKLFLHRLQHQHGMQMVLG